jgi:hypothetical protein
MKYLNTIILIIILIIVGILIYRWYFRSFEGFITSEDSLIKINNTTKYNYLWSNNLFLEQTSKSGTESLIVFKKPKITDGISKILGTFISTNLDDTNKKAIIVSKDVKRPEELNKIFEFKDSVSTPVFNTLMTYDKLLITQRKNTEIIEILDKSISEINDIFLKINNELDNNYTIILYKNSLGEVGEVKQLTKTENGTLIYTDNNISYNAISFPIGSTVDIETRSGNKYKFKIPVNNMFDSNGNFIDITDIDPNKLFQNSSITNNSFNPFGKNGLGWYNNGIDNQTYYKNTNSYFNYNYAIGDSTTETGYIDKSNLFDYFTAKYGELDKIIKNTDESDLKYSGENNYIKIGNKIFFVKHIVDIKNNDIKYNINQRRNIVKNVYKEGTTGKFVSKTDCINKENSKFVMKKNKIEEKYTFRDTEIGTTSKCDSGQKLLSYGILGCLPKKQNRGYCINNNDYISSQIKKRLEKNYIIALPYVNREWIDSNEYESYKSINFESDSNTFKYKFIYCTRQDYTKTLSREYSINRNNTSTNSSTSINVENVNNLTSSINDLLNINENDLFNVFKRNIYACLWRDGEVMFENKYTDTDGNKFNMNFEYKGTTQGPKYSPYVIIRFNSPEDAKQYVANSLNKLQRKLIRGKFKNSTYETEEINLSRFSSIYSKEGNTIAQIKQNISDVLENIISDKIINDDDINNIKNELENIVNSFSSKIQLYKFNFMLTLPKYTIINKKETKNEFFNLYNGKVINSSNLLQYKIKKITVSIDNSDKPVNNILANNIKNLNKKMLIFKNKFEQNNEKSIEIINNIENNQLNHYPLSIYNVKAPRGYKSLGDIVGISGFTDDKSSSLYNVNPIKNIDEYGCVPENCAIKVRQWLDSDKVYEYKSENQYLALFLNPYTETFKAVTQEGSKPEGDVEKLVACVAKSGIIDELKKADTCANEYKRNYEKVLVDSTLDRSSTLFDKQEARMQAAIADRYKVIDSLKSEISQIKKQDRKATIINHNINRKKFQDLLDRQVYNMDKLITNLYSIISININMTELISKLKERGVTKEKIDEIISTIRAGKSLYSSIDSEVIDDVSTDSSTTTESGAEADAHIAEPIKLQRIIYKTKDGREQEMILRSLVESSCGCYFTDDEVIRTR